MAPAQDAPNSSGIAHFVVVLCGPMLLLALERRHHRDPPAESRQGPSAGRRGSCCSLGGGPGMAPPNRRPCCKTLRRRFTVGMFENPFYRERLFRMGLRPETAFGCAFDFLLYPKRRVRASRCVLQRWELPVTLHVSPETEGKLEGKGEQLGNVGWPPALAPSMFDDHRLCSSGTAALIETSKTSLQLPKGSALVENCRSLCRSLNSQHDDVTPCLNIR